MIAPDPHRPNLQPQTPREQPLRSSAASAGTPSSHRSPMEDKLPVSKRRLVASSGGENDDLHLTKRGIGFSARIGIAIGGLLACLAVASQILPSGVMEEKAHKNWQYVQLATDQTLAANGETRIVVLGSDKQPKVATSLGMGKQQEDTSTGASVVQAIQQGSSRDAVNAIVAAQIIPDVPNPPTDSATGQKFVGRIMAPTITEGMKQELISGDVNFFHLFIFDCCAEDGDVIDVKIDGQTFATVPITHAGATLSIPMANGRVTALAVQGVHDGGGGITVAFGSSEGDAFLGVLDVGQTIPLGVVTR